MTKVTLRNTPTHQWIKRKFSETTYHCGRILRLLFKWFHFVPLSYCVSFFSKRAPEWWEWPVKSAAQYTGLANKGTGPSGQNDWFKEWGWHLRWTTKKLPWDLQTWRLNRHICRGTGNLKKTERAAGAWLSCSYNKLRKWRWHHKKSILWLLKEECVSVYPRLHSLRTQP